VSRVSTETVTWYFAPTGIFPEGRENDLPTYGKSFCWHVDVVKIAPLSPYEGQ